MVRLRPTVLNDAGLEVGQVLRMNSTPVANLILLCCFGAL